MPSVALNKTGAIELINKNRKTLVQGIRDTSLLQVELGLQSQLKELEKNALTVYKALGFSGWSIEIIEQQLSQRIKQLQEETAALNGLQLNDIFLKALKNAPSLQLDYKPIFEHMRENFAKNLGDSAVSGKVAEAMINEILRGIRESYKDVKVNLETGQARSHGKLLINFAKPYEELSKQAKKLFDNYVHRHFGGLQGPPACNMININSGTTQTQISSNFLNMSFRLGTYNIEQLLTMPAESRDRLFKQVPRLKDDINRIFTREIVAKCSKCKPDILTKCIQDVLSAKPLAFFIGQNVEAMTGILGEIQGLYFFRRLLGNSKSLATVSWVGGLGNPHADLLLTQAARQFGIQIKNTSQQKAKMEVGFKTFGAKRGRDIVSQGGQNIYNFANTQHALNFIKDGPINSELFEAIQTFLAMQSFNIYYEYNANTKRAEKVDSNPQFVTQRNTIETCAKIGRQMVSLMAASLMYMQTSDSTKGDSNTLYLIGGTTLISAATILKDIIKEIRSTLSNFKLRVNAISASDTEKSARTIVDLYNNNGRLTNTTFKLSSSYVFNL